MEKIICHIFILLFNVISTFGQQIDSTQIVKIAKNDAKHFKISKIDLKSFKSGNLNPDYFKPTVATMSDTTLLNNPIYLTAYRNAAYKKVKSAPSTGMTIALTALIVTTLLLVGLAVLVGSALKGG